MKILATILLVCLTLVSAGQAPIVKKVPKLQFTSQTSLPHGFHKLSANEGAAEFEETDHEALPTSDLRESNSIWTVVKNAPRKADDVCRVHPTETSLYLRVCRILI